MFFLHLSCKKGNFLPVTTWLLLSSFGILLTSKLVYIHFIAQPNAINGITTNVCDSENKYDQLNITTAANKKFVTLHTNYVLPFNAPQGSLTLNIFLIIAMVICRQLHNLQTQFFSNKRAPPLY
ncbi:hypothetical protein [Candidatus Bartonella washoeensis]|uniref:Uncharacterized protein n=1 Tax=Cardidatus Bartonella washoeensis 085-0475 TaxID=1094564 RepID=J1JNS7_9HYPH|nr:hypothetical protein [Bartonella washoeensis]EJF86392.1 hypothetical protein MCW_00288 [Bartonella washoeensis 085-0475]